jgi:hypothetical protein
MNSSRDESMEKKHPRGKDAVKEKVGDQRLRYEKPRILFRRNLEAVAAVCDPNTGGKDVVPDNCTLFAGS